MNNLFTEAEIHFHSLKESYPTIEVLQKERPMPLHEETIAKIRQLPESLVQEVNDFVEFLLMKHNRELLEIAESDFSDYLSNLEDYEEHLARGEIQW
ncbi:DUF2281 domain-containing protein [Aerosakkonema sp. BLCC-F183]|uniref:DUF2281 domain-containing protein n=1 Tax=Aerosakkonema sp. BLCC-F183 TaxID=3342834 RepID=UPI0035BB15AA